MTLQAAGKLPLEFCSYTADAGHGELPARTCGWGVCSHCGHSTRAFLDRGHWTEDANLFSLAVGISSDYGRRHSMTERLLLRTAPRRKRLYEEPLRSPLRPRARSHAVLGVLFRGISRES